MTKISIFADDARETRGSKAWGSIEADELQAGIKEIVQSLSPSFIEAENTSEGLSVQEVEIEIAVSAAGKVGLFGSGMEAKGAAKIKVKLGR